MIDTNIRELEGALIRVVAYSSLINEDITSHLAARGAEGYYSCGRPQIDYDSGYPAEGRRVFGLKMEDFKARKRTKAVAFPRQIAMYLSRELTDFSLPKIGEAFGGRDHTTVIHAHEKISKSSKKDQELYKIIHNLTDKIKNMKWLIRLYTSNSQKFSIWMPYAINNLSTTWIIVLISKI